MNPYYDPNTNPNQYKKVNTQNKGAYYPNMQNGYIPPSGYVAPGGYYPHNNPSAANPYQQNSAFSGEQLKQYYYYKNKRKKEQNNILIKGFALGAAIIAYLIIQTVIILIVQAIGLMPTYESSSLFQNCINIVAIHLCSMTVPFSIMAYALRKKSARPLIPTKKVEGLKLASWVFIGLGASMAANVATNAVITLFKQGGYELSQPELIKPSSLIEYIALIFSTAIVPAIFEEYAFRCCTMSALKVHGKAFAVIAVSVVFGLIHGNMIQFVFAFLVGCALGYVTLKTDSVVPAMLIHGLNNGLSVVNDIVTAEAGKKTADTVVTIIVVIYVVGAIGGLVYLISKKDFLLPKDNSPKEPFALTLGQKIALMLPGLAIPFAVLIYLTKQYITKS